MDTNPRACRSVVAATLACLLVSACTSPGTAQSTVALPSLAVSPTPAGTVSATPGPQPTASATAFEPPTPGPVSHVAPSSRTTSAHWAGYTFPVSATGVRAEWTEPTATGQPNDEVFVWIGIGGWNYTVQNIAQVGTFAFIGPRDLPADQIWYEFVPVEPTAKYPFVFVSPGDRIYASVTRTGKASLSNWQITLRDLTSGDQYTKVMHFHSLNAYPSIVVEDPNKGPASPNGPFQPFARFTPVKFSGIEVFTGGRWVPVASLRGLRIDMVLHGKTLATAGPVNAASAFTVTRR